MDGISKGGVINAAGDPDLSAVGDSLGKSALNGEAGAVFRCLKIRLESLVAGLVDIEPLRVDFAVRDVGFLPALEQCNYALEVNDSPESASLVLRFDLVRDGREVFSLPWSPYHPQSLHALRGQGLRILNSRIVGSAVNPREVRFEVACGVAASLSCAFEHATGRIRLTLTNIDCLSSRRYDLDSFSLTPDIISAIEDFLLRRNQRLAVLLQDLAHAGHVVPPPLPAHSLVEPDSNLVSFADMKKRLRRKVVLTYKGGYYEILHRTKEFVVGRGPLSHLQVVVPSVSRVHAAICYRDGQFHLVDKSCNGTFLRESGKPEIYLHRSSRPLTGKGCFSLGDPVDDAIGTMVHFSVESR